MSENAKRSFKEVEIEYSRLCTKAGHLQYSIATLKKELDMVNQTLLDLNLEGAAAKSKEDSEAAAKPAAEEVKNESA